MCAKIMPPLPPSLPSPPILMLLSLCFIEYLSVLSRVFREQNTSTNHQYIGSEWWCFPLCCSKGQPLNVVLGTGGTPDHRFYVNGTFSVNGCAVRSLLGCLSCLVFLLRVCSYIRVCLPESTCVCLSVVHANMLCACMFVCTVVSLAMK